MDQHRATAQTHAGKRRRRARSWSIFCCSGLALLGCNRRALETGAEPPAHRSGATFVAANGISPAPGAPAAGPPDTGSALGQMGLGRIAELTMPAVVSVASTRAPEVQTPGQPFDDPFFHRFFGEGQGHFSLPHGGPAPEEHALGSGVIVGGNVILTNAHVVQGAKSLQVTAQDRRNLDVELAGVDPKSDLAVLRIKGDTKGLKALDFADSDAAHLGDLVLAVGNPFGVGETVTMGIVSAKGRADLGIADYEDFIQTDAAINPGNSGGALVDTEGRLLGIPTAILSRSGGYMGVGFAIPSKMAQPIMKSLLATGKVTRGYLGISIQDLDQDLAKALGVNAARGVLVSDVVAGGAAEKAGIQRGDVVLAINGTPVSTSGQLRNLVAAAGVGKPVEVEIWRNGASKKLAVTVMAMPQDKNAADNTTLGGEVKAPPLGLTLAPLDRDARQQLALPAEIKNGVVVTDVDAGGKASEAGIRRGDLILELNRTAITNPNQLEDAWQKSKGSVAVLVFRGGHTFYVAVPH